MAERKKSDREIKQEVERILAENELLREQAQQQGLAFSAPTREELEKKLRGETSNSPTITGMSWSSIVPLGGTCNYTVYLKNPDPASHWPCFVSVLFGPVNLFDSPADMVVGRDTRFPQLNSAPFSLTANGGTGQASFAIPIPTVVQKSTYLCNALVWAADLHDKGTYYDRGVVYVTVT